MTVVEARNGLRTFEPIRQPLSIGRRIAWQFTRLGRAKLCLWRACHRPDEASAWLSLERVLQGLRRKKKPGDDKTDIVICDLLVHLAWHSLHVGFLDESCHWLGELDEHHLDGAILSPRVSLRWSNLEKLLDANELHRYVEQAKRFLADPLVGRAETAAILKVIRIVYERISPTACADVLSAANAPLRKSAVFQVCLAICQCPQRFGSAGGSQSVGFSGPYRAPRLLQRFEGRRAIDPRPRCRMDRQVGPHGEVGRGSAQGGSRAAFRPLLAGEGAVVSPLPGPFGGPRRRPVAGFRRVDAIAPPNQSPSRSQSGRGGSRSAGSSRHGCSGRTHGTGIDRSPAASRPSKSTSYGMTYRSRRPLRLPSRRKRSLEDRHGPSRRLRSKKSGRACPMPSRSSGWRPTTSATRPRPGRSAVWPASWPAARLATRKTGTGVLTRSKRRCFGYSRAATARLPRPLRE